MDSHPYSWFQTFRPKKEQQKDILDQLKEEPLQETTMMHLKKDLDLVKLI